MSAAAASDPTSKSASKKKKRSKKKANGKVPEGGGKVSEANGVKSEQAEGEDEDEGEDEEGSELPVKGVVPNHVAREDTLHMPSSPPEPTTLDRDRGVEMAVRNGAQDQRQHQHQADEITAPARPTEEEREEEEDEDEDDEPSTQSQPQLQPSISTSNPSSRLDALQQERDSLRAEVTSLRQSLESLQERHSEEVSTEREDVSTVREEVSTVSEEELATVREEYASVKEELEQTQQDKEHAETQYRNLLGKVNTIRSQLGERLKADAAELDECRGRIGELETSNASAQEENERLQDVVQKLNARLEAQNAEIESLRSRTNLSTSNWAKERDDLITKEAYMREEFDGARQAMQDWEILATEERARREALEERAQELEEQLGAQREAFARVQGEADTQSGTVDGLQRALRDLQDERKRELRELVEQSQAQLEELRKSSQGAEDSATQLRTQLTTTQAELDRATPFETAVKEKNLLIGKLRHEAVILNDHLTKALRFLKRGKPEDNVDRQLVTNHFLHFLALDRSDPKKFQILQLIAALLGWSEEQREQAGLVRQGAMSLTGSLRVPISPFRRTPSTPSLSTDFNADSPASATTRESLAELWSEFLEREAEQGGGGGGSRRPSVASGSQQSGSMRSASVTSPVGGRGQSPETKRTGTGMESTRAGSSSDGR